MNLRAHLARVDRASVAGDAIGAIICGFITIKLIDLGPHQLVAEQRWMYVGFAAVAGVIGFVCAAGALWELARPESLAQKAKERRYEDRIAELDDELTATLSALRDAEAKATQLTNELDEARAERDHAVTKLSELPADLWDEPAPEPVVTSFGRAPDLFRALGAQPRHGQDTREAE